MSKPIRSFADVVTFCGEHKEGHKTATDAALWFFAMRGAEPGDLTKQDLAEMLLTGIPALTPDRCAEMVAADLAADENAANELREELEEFFGNTDDEE